MQLNTRDRVYLRACQVAMTTKMSVRVQKLMIKMLWQHRLSTSGSNVLLQTSKPCIKFSCNGKWKTVSSHLKQFVALHRDLNVKVM